MYVHVHVYTQFLPHTVQTLHVCLVTDGVWRWTKPFSVAGEGVEPVEVYIGRHTAQLSVAVTAIGGLQKEVCVCTCMYVCVC